MGILPGMVKRLGWYLPEQLVLKITLAGSDPSIWRRVEVESGLTLDDLHYVIQCVFNWNDEHLYQFLAPPGGKLTRKARREARRYDDMPHSPYFVDDDERSNERADEVMIGRIFTPECKQIVYEYDFGDSWEHIVKLERSTPGGDPDHIPQCVGGENAAPLEDVGGIYGFYQWIDALRKPKSEFHDEAVEWLGEDFDPARFDLGAANKRLARTFKLTPKRPRKPRKKK